MSGSVSEVLIAVAVPLAVAVAGGVIASFHPVGERQRSAIQHFAGGLIFAAVAVELLPEIHGAEPLAVALGAGAGLALMLGVRALAERSERAAAEDGGPEGGPRLIATIGVDLLIDGLLLGIAFSIGSEQGVLLTIGLSFEVLALALVVSGKLHAAGASRAAAALTPAALVLLLALGAVIGVSALGGLSGPAFAAIVGLGSVALLYLVVEELLTDAHETPDTPLITSSFFAGFLLLLLLGG
jgi:ZIP family zinc transporter